MLAPSEVGELHVAQPSIATHGDDAGPLPVSLTAGGPKLGVSEFKPVLTENYNIQPVMDPLDVLMTTNAATGQAMPVPFVDPATRGSKDQIEKIRDKNLLLQEARKKKAVYDEDTYNFLANQRRDPELANRYLSWVLDTDATNPKMARMPPQEYEGFDPYDYTQNNYFGKLQSWRNNYQKKADPSDPKNELIGYEGGVFNMTKHGNWDGKGDPPGKYTMEKGAVRAFPGNIGEQKPYDINAITDHTPGNLPAILEREQNILRAHFQTASKSDVIPTPQRQLQSDVLFDMFSVVPPGFGLGQTNKLFVENEQRDAFYRYTNNFFPRADDGPPTGVTSAPWQWQDNIPKSVLATFVNEQLTTFEQQRVMLASVTDKTARTLPGDVNVQKSSRGLVRPPGFLRPVITNHEPLVPVSEPAGLYLNSRGFRHLHSPVANPTIRETDAENGGSHFRRRRAMAFVNP